MISLHPQFLLLFSLLSSPHHPFSPTYPKVTSSPSLYHPPSSSSFSTPLHLNLPIATPPPLRPSPHFPSMNYNLRISRSTFTTLILISLQPKSIPNPERHTIQSYHSKLLILSMFNTPNTQFSNISMIHI